MTHVLRKLQNMGFLRNLLHGSALVATLLLPFARAIDYSGDWNLFFAGILPAVSPIIVILIGMDTMISSIRRADAEDNAVQVSYYSGIIRANQIFGAMLLGMWLLIFLPILV